MCHFVEEGGEEVVMTVGITVGGGAIRGAAEGLAEFGGVGYSGVDEPA